MQLDLDVKSYQEFKKSLAESCCDRCPLSQKRTHIVVDRGNPEASVLMIGEAPGENEDLQGRAFIGRGGQLLDKAFQEIDFDTNQDSLIINVVKCRPPDNRRPTPEEADACQPFLKKQISLVQPKIILLLGATAVKHIIKGRTGKMASQVGQFFEDPAYPGVKLMVLYHPAYILRDPRKRPEMMKHLAEFKKEWFVIASKAKQSSKIASDASASSR